MINLEQVTKRFGPTTAVDALDLEIAAGEICVLVGPSGCGKSTTLRMINRLIEPTAGRIVIDGRDVTKVDPVGLRRGIGYVIQQVGLFPHLTVADNVATVPKLLGWARDRIEARVDELLTLVGLDPAVYRTRYPAELSGGQRQRVGVARALGADPPILLMDEPFGAIDPITRDRLQGEFLRLQEELRKTVVFVTHDITEAVRLGDRIALLAAGGHLVQHATPAELLGNPANDFVADFVGADRALKRLEVTTVTTKGLESPPVAHPSEAMAAALAKLNGHRPAIVAVIGGDGRLQGWVGRGSSDSEAVSADAAVADHLRPAPAAAILGKTSLKDALSDLLLADDGWMPVTDESGTFLGVLTPDAVHRATRG